MSVKGLEELNCVQEQHPKDEQGMTTGAEVPTAEAEADPSFGLSF